jgi:tripeptide aminopeptidase
MCFNVDSKLAAELITGAVGSRTGKSKSTARLRMRSGSGKGHFSHIGRATALVEAQRDGWFGKVVKPDGKGTSNPGIFGGKNGKAAGDATNVVTDYVYIKGEARSATRNCRNHRGCVSRRLQEGGDDGKMPAENCGSEVQRSPLIPPFKMADNEPALVHAKRAAESIGLKPTTIFSNGGLDANWLVRHGSRPSPSAPGR